MSPFVTSGRYSCTIASLWPSCVITSTIERAFLSLELEQQNAAAAGAVERLDDAVPADRLHELEDAIAIGRDERPRHVLAKCSV